MQLSPYSEYKDSGVPWLGKIPKHWTPRKVKHLFNERVQKGFPFEPLLAATQHHGVILKHNYKTRTVTAQKDLHLLKLVEIGDFVISLRSFQGGIEYSFCRGIISPAYTVMVPFAWINSHYFRYLAKSTPFLSLLRMCVTGIREGQNIDYERLRREPLPVPTFEEQKTISLFLNWKTSQINKFIRNKRRLIALLKEQKQNIINNAVTRGLNPDVKLKPSGVDWIGDIPEHWEIKRLKFLCRNQLQYGINEPSGDQQENNAPRYIRITDIGKDGRLREETICTVSHNLAKEHILSIGDILFARSGATVGKTFCYNPSWGTATFAGYLIRATIDFEKIDHNFLYLYTQSKAYASWVALSFIKATIHNISAEKYASLWVVVPPHSEQLNILRYVGKHTQNIDTAISRAEREIELMTEYRDRLIADVVTGKVDVRGIDVPELAPEELDDMPEERDDPEELDKELSSMVEEEEDA